MDKPTTQATQPRLRGISRPAQSDLVVGPDRADPQPHHGRTCVEVLVKI
jgi:hypothetical protein